MNNTKIDWCDMSWNPITGCRHGCAYCYARRIARRFCGKGSFDPESLTATNGIFELEKPALKADGKTIAPYPFGFDPTFHRYKLDEPAKKKKPQNIFVGSMADVFGEWVPERWIYDIFAACKRAPQHNYLFLTKAPGTYQRLRLQGSLPQEENFWYGTTVTGEEDIARVNLLPVSRRTFLSMEPLMGPVNLEKAVIVPDWIIIGAMTGAGGDNYRPEREWVEDIVAYGAAHNIPVFMKKNLAPVWGEPLITELPDRIRGMA